MWMLTGNPMKLVDWQWCVSMQLRVCMSAESSCVAPGGR
jgi:hypothetical protein